MVVSRRVWVISEVYYPEEAATGYFMTRLAEGLAEHRDVGVLCGQPKYDARGVSAPWREVLNGVSIERCRGTRLNKNILPLRLVNVATITLSIFFAVLRRIRKGDTVVVVTNPPLLPFVVAPACRWRGAKCILRIDDVYPEALIATGIARPGSVLVQILTWVNRRLYRGVDRIVVLGRDMRNLAQKKLGGAAVPVAIIHNWADVDLIAPAPKSENALLRELGLAEKFVVACAGNMGRAQGIENMFRVAELLQGEKDIHFLFIGSGAKRPWMESEVVGKTLTNVTILDQRPRSDQPNFLNACDVSMASLLPGMAGAGVPSRMYNTMAAGKPIIAIAEAESELSMVVEEELAGWVVPPNKPEKLAQAILDARSEPGRLAGRGARARAAVEAKYTARHAIDAYYELVKAIDGAAEPAPSVAAPKG